MELKNLENEIFIPVKGYETEYMVSNYGRVKSLPKKDGRAGRILSQENQNKSVTTYKRVSLSKDGKVTRFQVHRLVAQAFIPNPENKPQVNHIDFNGSNNHISNLEWVTRSENELHSVKNNYVKQQVLKQRHIETSKRMKDLQLDILKNWENTDLGYATVIKCELQEDKIPLITLRCNICASLYNIKQLSSLRRALNKNEALSCKSCSVKMSRYGFIPNTPLVWTTKINLINEKYRHGN